MVFCKIIKNSSYYSRFQVKPRRRREGKTDYKARRKMVTQELCKYNTPKYRFVVRFTNKRVIAMICWSTMAGDRVLAYADSTELTRYGMPVGHTNYAAAYATGLLCARRVLKTLKLDEVCVGVTGADGKEYHIEEEDTKIRPFKCILDIGLVHTSTGHRVFGAMKGAVDGGLHIPHSCKRFPGYVKGSDGVNDSYDAEAHRVRIFGVHVAKYMRLLQEENPDKYQSHFSRYIKSGLTADNLEEHYAKLHAAIRANPDREKKKQIKYTVVREGNYIRTTGEDGSERRLYRPVKLTKEQRKERLQAKLSEIARLAAAAMDAE